MEDNKKKGKMDCSLKGEGSEGKTKVIGISEGNEAIRIFLGLMEGQEGNH